MANPKAVRPSRLLVASPDDAVRRGLADALRERGFEVVKAADGDAALGVIAEHAPDLVIFDAALDVPDGDPICARTRRIAAARQTPIVMLVRAGQSAVALAAFESGADDVMLYPAEPLLLAYRARQLLAFGQMRSDLEWERRRLDDLQRIARVATWERDVEGGDIYAGPTLRALFGMEPAPGPLPLEDLLSRLHGDDRAAVENLLRKSAELGDGFSVDTRVAMPDESRRVLHWRAEVSSDAAGRPQRISGTMQDITERRQAEQQLRFLTHHDRLTGLANRTAFIQRLSEALRDTRRGEEIVALLVVDVDNFKRVNEILGHAAGDKLLQGVAGRLENSLRSTDRVSRLPNGAAGDVSRLGADEFTVVLSGMPQVDDVSRVARRVIGVLREPFVIDGAELIVSASIGIAVHPTDGDDVDTLLRSAHAAMYKAKEKGRNSFCFFTDSIQDPGSRRYALEQKLCRAFENHELRIFYQPQFDLATGELTGVEALLRWEDAEFGAISPAEFVPLAEEAGLITPIGEWVLRTACWQAKAWRDAGLPDVRMAVNVSPHHFETETFVETVNQTLWDTGMDPNLLELEITESALMRNQESVVAILGELKRIGVSISLDDFGTGYSSLSYLKRFPVDAVKIDRSFVRDIAMDPDDAAITSAIISMAKALRLRVVAEGVETERQRSYLRERGCDEMQGFLASPPIDADSMADLLREVADSGELSQAEPEDGASGE